MSEKDDTVTSYEIDETCSGIFASLMYLRSGCVWNEQPIKYSPEPHNYFSDIQFPIIRRRQPSAVFL